MPILLPLSAAGPDHFMTTIRGPTCTPENLPYPAHSRNARIRKVHFCVKYLPARAAGIFFADLANIGPHTWCTLSMDTRFLLVRTSVGGIPTSHCWANCLPDSTTADCPQQRHASADHHAAAVFPASPWLPFPLSDKRCVSYNQHYISSR